jgi:serine/threonine-protein kinase RsbW
VSTPIRLTIPATSTWVVLARTTATACCARLDFDVDRLEDVRLAVDEVATMLIAEAQPGTDIQCEFAPYADGRLEITLRARTTHGTLPPTNTFAWAVLTALVDDITTAVDSTALTVVLRTSRATASTVEA